MVEVISGASLEAEDKLSSFTEAEDPLTWTAKVGDSSDGGTGVTAVGVAKFSKLSVSILRLLALEEESGLTSYGAPGTPGGCSFC